jgi:hypothetical protein
VLPSPETTSVAAPGASDARAGAPETHAGDPETRTAASDPPIEQAKGVVPEAPVQTPGPESEATPFGPEPKPEPQPLPRAQPGELAAAGCALLLLVLMFAVEWFGVDRLPGKANGLQRETAENAWTALTMLRWLMLLTIVAAVGAVILHATQRGHGARNDTGAIVFGLGAITAILLIYRVLIDLPSSYQVVDQKLGAILGMVSAVGIALAGYRSMYEERANASEHPSKRMRSRVARRSRRR